MRSNVLAAAPSARSHLGRGPAVQRKRGEQAVPHELQHLAVELLDAGHQAVEVAVQRLDHLVTRALLDGCGKNAIRIG